MEIQAVQEVAVPSSIHPEQTTLQAMVAKAATILSPVWPLKTVIACNPLQGLESLPFEEAVATGAVLFQATDAEPGLVAVNRQVIKWCHAFLDEGQATLPMPWRSAGFYRAWKRLAPFDAQLNAYSKRQKHWLKTLPDKPEDALLLCLNELGVPTSEQESFLKQTLTYLPGWGGYIKYRTDWQQPTTSAPNPVTLVDFLAVRLAITCLLWPAAQQPRQFQVSNTALEVVGNTLAQLNRTEAAYRDELLGHLLPKVQHVTRLRKRPDAQFVFCIDVRSEPFRRCLEAQGAYETFGFAGFFGLPVRLHDHGSGELHDACPVLLKPRHVVEQKPISNDPLKLARFGHGKRTLSLLKAFYEDLKYNFATPFALVETLGAGCGLLMLGRTLAPALSQKSRQVLTEAIRPVLPTEPDLCSSQADQGISPEQQAIYAETALRLMGLTDNFGKLVVFCGHGSTTQNNPYASSLDCGACGGNHGGPNAQLLARMLNTPSVRKKLFEHNLPIPADTVFMAAEHNTTTDEVKLYETTESGSHPALHQTLQQALIAARLTNTANRTQAFGKPLDGIRAVEATVRRSTDWAEVRPEWGLARNAGFIVGPRQLTQAINLEGRCFLHSYDWQQDTDQTLLETVLTAPMVVAQWINSQYLFSTLDNVAFGSGSKVTHNVAGKLGIMQGNASDLMHGLPLQSVYASDHTPYHRPQRLTTIVYAPRYAISLIIDRQPILQTLFGNGWVKLIAIEPTEGVAYQLNRSRDWQKL